MVLYDDDWNINPAAGNTSRAGIVLYDDCWRIKNDSYGLEFGPW